MKTIHKRLIQNYFELNGNFDKIAASDAGSLLKDSDSMIEQCFQVLGYKPIDKFSAKQVYELRVAFKCLDMTTIFEITGISSLEEARKELTEKNILPEKISRRKAKVAVAKKFIPYCELLAKLFKHSDKIVKFPDDKSLHSLRSLLSSFRVQPSKLASNVSLLMSLNPELITFTQSTKCFIYRDTFYIDRETSEKDQEYVIEKALKLATGVNSVISKEIATNPAMIVTLPFTENEKYRELLEEAAAQGKTYAQMFSEIDVNICDCAKVYRCTGIIPHIFNNVVYVITEDSTDKEPVVVVSLDSLKRNLALMSI